MSAKRVLKDALAVVGRDHTPTQLAVNQFGVKVRPLDPTAVAWSTVGALVKVAPSNAEAPFPQHTDAAWQAFLLLTEAAEQQGYAHTTAVDQTGVAAVQTMFWRALQLAEPEPRRRRRGAAVGTGGSPRGAVA